MGLPSMTPVLGILDDVDRPEAKMLVIVWGNPSAPMVEYLNQLIRPLGYGRKHGRKHCSFPSGFTDIRAFGMSACFEPDGRLRIRPGRFLATAVYPDGQQRRWQGRSIEVIEYRPMLATHIMKAVQLILTHEAVGDARAKVPA